MRTIARAYLVYFFTLYDTRPRRPIRGTIEIVDDYHSIPIYIFDPITPVLLCCRVHSREFTLQTLNRTRVFRKRGRNFFFQITRRNAVTFVRGNQSTANATRGFYLPLLLPISFIFFFKFSRSRYE